MTDAENLMPFPTSDLRNPICLEMRLLRSGAAFGMGEPTSILSSGAAVDIGSIDSSDTYASCNTQPFNSQGDLTEDSNLYVNPLTEGAGPPAQQPQSTVKKSASGDTALRSLGASPIDETYKGFAGAQERGSRGSLNEAPLPKHRKTRFQQSVGVVAAQGRFVDSVTGLRESQESLETIKKRRPSFMPSKPLATATRIINQHLFGIQTLAKTPNRGKNGESRSSLSADSIDSRTCPTPETLRRSKSILKKHDSGGSGGGGGGGGGGSGSVNHRAARVSSSSAQEDPETEKLIPDSMSGSDYSPGKSPPTTLRTVGGGAGRGLVEGPGGRALKFVGLVGEEGSSQVSLLHDLLVSPPLYICPPPPPLDHSPTEETKLLTHRGLRTLDRSVVS